jgi:MFS family permease
MQRKVWVLSAVGVGLDGFDFFIIGVALPLIVKDFGPTSWQVGAIGAAAVLGAALGALLLGPVTDRLGRRAMYKYDLLLFVAFTALSALAWDAWSLIAFRFLVGVGIGADYPISAAYVSETTPARIRGRLVSATIGFQALGMLAGAGGGLLVLLADPAVGAWRWMLAAGDSPTGRACEGTPQCPAGCGGAAHEAQAGRREGPPAVGSRSRRAVNWAVRFPSARAGGHSG